MRDDADRPARLANHDAELVRALIRQEPSLGIPGERCGEAEDGRAVLDRAPAAAIGLPVLSASMRQAPSSGLAAGRPTDR